MWPFDLLQYELTPTAKLLITWSIALALFLVYCWNPNKKKPKEKKNDNSIMNYVEVDPYEMQGDPSSIRPRKKKVWQATHNETLQELDDYVKSIKENNLNSMDEV